MSSADPEEVSVEIEREGITVEKSFEPDDFPVPAIAFVVRSDRDVPVDVTLVDVVPEDIQAEDIGFHPKYGAEHWRNDGDRLIFERTFEAGEEYTTVYGLRARDTEDVGRFLGEPELTEIVPQGDSSQVVRDVINESEGMGGASDDDLEAAIAAADIEDISTEEVASQPSPSPAAASLSPEAVVSMLAEGIRTGQVPDSDLEVLRDALGTEGATPNSLEVRIDHLQNEVADLDAYTSALEGFIDENGDAQTLLRDIREAIDGVQADVAELENEIESVSDEVGEASERVATMSQNVEQLDDEVEQFGTDLEEVDSDVTEVESSVESVEGRVEEFDTKLSEVGDEIASLQEDLASVQDEVGDVRGEVGDVRDEIPEGRVDELEGRMDDIRGELEELSEMRKRMTSVFGGMGGGLAEASDEADETDDAEATESDEVDEE